MHLTWNHDGGDVVVFIFIFLFKKKQEIKFIENNIGTQKEVKLQNTLKNHHKAMVNFLCKESIFITYKLPINYTFYCQQKFNIYR